MAPHPMMNPTTMAAAGWHQSNRCAEKVSPSSTATAQPRSHSLKPGTPTARSIAPITYAALSSFS